MSSAEVTETIVRAADTELLRAEHLAKHFPIKGAFGRTIRMLKAVDDVSLSVFRGETLAVVGESGSGKTTLGRCMMQMDEATSGRIFYDGVELTALSEAERLTYHRQMQVVYQDPFSSLNPHRTALEQVLEPLQVLAADADPETRALEALTAVGITGADVYKYPRNFSGGQRQRIGIARAISVRPAFVFCDEPVSSLDLSVQAQVLQLLHDLQTELGLTYLFVSHDLAVVRDISTRTAVMHRGRIVELGTTAAVFETPEHPYTKALLSATPIADPKLARERHGIGWRNRVAYDGHGNYGDLVEISPSHWVAGAVPR
ncbi:MAG: ATP-binding cassette domain-containing protein [Propionibacteriaceae bacterium]|jgi:ABC-type oligopeptide transport system ATPase subunit|nr:ATP-binding cassette domain-containing protein [Propionibacteriaceae bacterium]